MVYYMRFTDIRLYIFTIIILICTIYPSLAVAEGTREIKGVVIDSLTNQPLPYVSVYLQGTTNGAMTDEQGMFKFKSSSTNSILVASSLGYHDQKYPITKGVSTSVTIYMKPVTYDMQEVIVKPKKEKYRKKDNPAVELAEKLITSKNSNNPGNHDFFQYERYEKMTFALNDFSEEQKKKWLFKKFQFIFEYVDTSEVSGKPILAVSVKEKFEQNYYRKSPQTKKQVVSGIKRAGIDEMFNQESMQELLGEIFKEIDIYGNDITLMLNRFVSPLSNIGTSFYKYYLLDTVMVNGEKCIDLGFVPFNSESFGFTGHLYVTTDSTYFIKKVKLNVPKDINLNYVANLSIDQEFDRAPDGTRLQIKDDIIVEFQIIQNTQGLYARRTNTYRKHNFEPPANLALFDDERKIIVEDDAGVKPDAFWTDNRHIPIKKKENAIDKLLVQLRDVPVFYYTEKILTILVSGYIETGSNSKFDFGPMNTTISGNTAEGVRLRVGGITTANLNPRLFAKGYVAYGTRDGIFKYSGEVEYSFIDKKYHTREFPIHSVRLSHTYDINQLGQHYLYTNKDNVFLALKRKADNLVTYQRKTEFKYTREHESGFSYGGSLRYKTEEATKWVEFIENDRKLNSFSIAEAEINLRYAPNEKFYQTKTTRYPINRDAPIITLSHVVGVKGILNSRYNLNHTEVGIQKRFWFSAFGYTDIILKAGKVWDKVPYPLLIIPNANLSYTIQDESYSMMNAMEFINDQYISWDITYFMNGLIFNRIPLIKYMKLREVISFRGLYGNLTPKNNPSISSGLYEFPSYTQPMERMPYMEAGIGLDNIFKILRVDYVWRLTYRDRPDISKSGVRIALHFNF